MRYARLCELGLFIAWHTEAFHRQKKLDGFTKVLETFRANNKPTTGQPVMDWRLEKEHMQAIRERHGATIPQKRKGDSK